MNGIFLVLMTIVGGAVLMARADEMTASIPNATTLSQHLQQVKSQLLTPEQFFKDIAEELEAGKTELAFAHFSPSDTNLASLRSMGDFQRTTMAAALRRARLKKTLNEHARTYEMPFEEDGKTQWTELSLIQGPDGSWTIYSW